MTDQAGARKPTNFPWLRNSEEDLDTGALGGQVMTYKAAATLLVGDQVFLSAANTVNKSTTQAEVGKTAALINQLVYVAWAGRVTVPATGVIAAGDIVGASAATAGAVVTPAVSGRTAIAATTAAASEVDIILPYL